ncbi:MULTISPECIES: response regulator [unclassified Leisingera]|uniref:response regulator n=1 Tax=unclassified Leisingera TaxID=2614906 RepID=UPI0005805791|nr:MULTISPECIES: response regulator [unclassified Leisingera]KIC17118.1 chemotaxis protein CheY [Leisingera sp. ANG-DT]KIC31088.1 chemotaxis protein CheY [Leisingera sp. ANG-M6]KIC33960.1 chemotaxis protein CheY [Leisingera sp. ANG-S5]
MQSPRNASRPALNIILVEDDDGDAKALRRAFEQARIANPVTRFADGVEALAFLRGEMSQVPPPHFVVLSDINMPRKNGIELLREIRADPVLHNILFIVLTTSDDDRDISEAYANNVAGYILKSKAGDMFTDLMATLDNYWRIVELPEIHIRKVTDGGAQHPAH